MSYNKDTVKEQLSFEDVYSLLESLDAEPEMQNEIIICKTICHGGESHKLYYYENTQLFRCYTHCGDAFDIFDLISKVKNIDLNTAIYYVANFFNLQHRIEEFENDLLSEDWTILKRWSDYNELEPQNKNKILLPEIQPDILDNYPQPFLKEWELEYIPKEVCDYMGIRYDPVNGGILIPHYDERGRLIGIRERTLIQENEKYGKYKPAKIQNKMRNHPLGFNLYGLDKAKDRIKETGIAMVFESEKSVLQCINYLGTKSNIAVSMCGSTLSNYQFQLLRDAGAEKICIGIDKDYHILYDEDYFRILQKIDKMYNKYSGIADISFMFDVRGLTGYKCSPTDCGKEIFLELWVDRLTPNNG